MKFHYQHTLYACCIGYITQAIVSNLPPILFVLFQDAFSLSLKNITVLVTLGFCIQIIVDILASRFVAVFGYRLSITIANLCCIGGLISMALLPLLIHPFLGLLIGISLNSIGGGFIEVVVSPLVQALPGDKKAGTMSMLHSFYCWGAVGVVLLSTLFFTICGTENWNYLLIFWSIVPFLNMLLFLKVPIKSLMEKDEQLSAKKLLSQNLFWILFILMICAGATEQSMSKWSSLFAELGLGVSKTLGDLFGPCTFALFMGLTRLLYSRKSEQFHSFHLIMFSGILCMINYLIVSFSPVPFLSLLGCALTGLSVGILWPAVLSLAAKTYPAGGNTMFGLMALGGDIGCAVGPGAVGFISNTLNNPDFTYIEHLFPGANVTQSALKAGLFVAILFPIVILFSIRLLKKQAA